jgi:hypothetical protein
MPSTYEPIATNTLVSAATTVTFSSIPSTYTDLVLVTNIKDASTYALLRVGNGSVDTGSNYSRTYLLSVGASGVSQRTANATSWYLSAGASEYDYNVHNLQNYANTTTYKTSIERATTSADGTYTSANLWRSTSAINIISIISATGTASLAAGSIFTLYGIAAA